MNGLYDWFGPMVRMLPPEAAHRATITALRSGLVRGETAGDDPVLQTTVWQRQFPNPIGLAAGFDKNAEVYAAMLRLGFGFVEVGSITPRPQPGNPKPRIFRLTEDAAVINRLGFNSAGLDVAVANLRHRNRVSRGIIGVNLGKNRDSADAAADYAAGATVAAPLADYLVVNVSSPNTPGLRSLQAASTLKELLRRVRDACRPGRSAGPPPLLLKIAPDLSPEDRTDIAHAALDEAIDGMIVTNTTVSRPSGLRSLHASETGGLSGRPLFRLSTEVLGDMYRLTQGRLPLVGVGGVSSGRDAYAKIRAGASLVQLYTALIFQGPGLVGRLKRELAACLRADGFSSVASAVGADHR